jgi:membrane dipeptidase
MSFVISCSCFLIFFVDHADYIGRLAGREHVGIGSDFDGIPSTPEGLEDVSKYPSLITELIKRGWSDREIVGLAGGSFFNSISFAGRTRADWRRLLGNLLRVLEKVEAAAYRLRHLKPTTEIFEGRKDLKKHDSF